MKYDEEYEWLIKASAVAEPADRPDIIEWAQEFVRLPGSARSESFDISITPWLRAPLYCGVDLQTRIGTLVKPVQSGGSVLGEVLMLYWMRFAAGFLQYNWHNDKRATERWESRIEGIINACAEIVKMLDGLKAYDANKQEIDFGKLFFRMQGVYVVENLDSDSIALQLNEEVHAWEPGHLAKARARQTAVWNAKAFDISNASNVDDQLQKAYLDGTQEQWLVKCPGCRDYHPMRCRWEDRRPDLGGLRYDSAAAKKSYGYDYNVIKSTLFYQMPCGFQVHDDPMERRSLSLSGKYSDPAPGSDIAHRSWTYDGVTVDYISWLNLVREKQQALKARKNGDNSLWIKYLTERECRFYDPEDTPVAINVITTKTLFKNRDGLPQPRYRFFSLDRQPGKVADGEVPHWWLVIRDAHVGEHLKTLLVYEGKLETDEEVIRVLDDHECRRWHGVADSGDDTSHVYAFCMRYGINAIKGGSEEWYTHPGGARRIFSPERPLHAMRNMPPMFPYVRIQNPANPKSPKLVPDPREPLFWLYSKVGIRERLHWLRTNTEYLTPADVSEDYVMHNDAEERKSRQHPRTGETIWEYVQHRRRNDLYVCEAYIGMEMEQAGIVKEKGKQQDDTAKT